MASDLSEPESTIRPEVEKEPGPLSVSVHAHSSHPRVFEPFPFIFSSVLRDKGQS